jgi:hypothetical protein
MEKRSFEDIEKDLLTHLSAANLPKDHLAGISRSIAASYNAGMQIVDWWVYGIPAFEKLVIQAQLPIAETKALQSLVQNESFKAIEIHRKGIPRPDFFQLQLTVERTNPLERPSIKERVKLLRRPSRKNEEERTK